MESRPAIDVAPRDRLAARPQDGCSPGGARSAARLRASLSERLIQALGALGAWAVLLIAVGVEPSPEGLGTHVRLGMQPCVFHQMTGRPCPGCGLTTAFADMAHGRVVEALVAQPFGAVLFALVLVLASGLTVSAVGGRSCKPLLYSAKAPLVIYGLIVLWLASWGFKTLYGEVTGHYGL